MASTLADLRTRIKQTFKRTDKDTEIDQAINDTHKEMVAAIFPRKTQDQVYKSTTVGREEYPLPSTMLRLNHPIRLIDPTASNNSSSNHPLKFLSKAEYDVVEPNPNVASPQKGRPWAYCIYKNSILITDLPDKAYTLELNIGGEETELAAETDQSIFNDQWDEILASGALARLYIGLQLYEDAKIFADIYNNGYVDPDTGMIGGMKLLGQIEKEQRTAPTIVKFNRL